MFVSCRDRIKSLQIVQAPVLPPAPEVVHNDILRRPQLARPEVGLPTGTQTRDGQDENVADPERALDAMKGAPGDTILKVEVPGGRAAVSDRDRG